MLTGSPNLVIISLSRSFATSVGFSVLVGYASAHPDMSTKTNKNVKFPMHLGTCKVLSF